MSFKNGVTGTVYHEKIKALKELDWPKLYLDIGAAGAAAAREHIRIGDMACLHQPFVNLGGRYMAKAMDDRIGCAVLVEAARRLPGSLPQGLLRFRCRRWDCAVPPPPLTGSSQTTVLPSM